MYTYNEWMYTYLNDRVSKKEYHRDTQASLMA